MNKKDLEFFEKAIFWLNYSQNKVVPMEGRKDALHMANICILRSCGCDSDRL